MFDNTFQEKSWILRRPIYKIKHWQPISDLRDVSEPNGTAHGDFCAETNLLS